MYVVRSYTLLFTIVRHDDSLLCVATSASVYVGKVFVSSGATSCVGVASCTGVGIVSCVVVVTSTPVSVCTSGVAGVAHQATSTVVIRIAHTDRIFIIICIII